MFTFDEYFATSAEMMLICDRSGKIIKVNDRWEEKLGYTREELEGHYFLNFVHPDDVPVTMNRFGQTLKSLQDFGFINRY